MTEQQQHDYQSHVRGAATWILLGKTETLMDAAELVRLYGVDLATVTADINAIVQAEHAKAGGIFETMTPQAPKQTLASQMPASAGSQRD